MLKIPIEWENGKYVESMVRGKPKPNSTGSQCKYTRILAFVFGIYFCFLARLQQRQQLNGHCCSSPSSIPPLQVVVVGGGGPTPLATHTKTSAETSLASDRFQGSIGQIQ